MRAIMRPRWVALLVAVALGSAGTGYCDSAKCDEAKGEWEIEGHFAYAVYGSNHPTGGIMPTLEGRHLWKINDTLSWHLGAGIGAFGLSDNAHWIGVIGGPTIGARAQWKNGLGLGLSFAADFGRIPICNAWDLCLRYVGFYPALVPSITYATESHVSFGFACPVRYVNTLGWEGVAVEPAAIGRLYF